MKTMDYYRKNLMKTMECSPSPHRNRQHTLSIHRPLSTYSSGSVQPCLIFNHSHQDLDLIRVRLWQYGMEFSGVESLGSSGLTCIDEAMEKALGWRTGMRSSRYGNGICAIADGKSYNT